MKIPNQSKPNQFQSKLQLENDNKTQKLLDWFYHPIKQLKQPEVEGVTLMGKKGEGKYKMQFSLDSR